MITRDKKTRLQGFQQYRFKILNWAKYSIAALLVLGFFASVQYFLDTLYVKKIETLNQQSFRELVVTVNLDRMSLPALEAFAAKALEISPPEIVASAAATKLLMKSDATCLNCQNRIVFFDLTKNLALTETGLTALKNSFELSPYGDENLMKWRLEVASEYWSNLDDDLKKSALSQVTGLSQSRKNREWLKEFSTEVEEIAKRVARLGN